MASRKDNTNPPSGQKSGEAASAGSAKLLTEKITVGPDSGSPRPLARHFPGPKKADAALRVAIERRAYADLLAHAKESLEVEVCGVLVGQICEDEEGLFVHVEAALRGSAASQARTHVTFTQATWNSIHKTMETDYPKLRMVGWYHTHPGFGVEFSDMDLFIQKNFFAGPAQIALVTDPLSGAVAICVNTASGARYLPRFWVDGREQPCRIPGQKGGGGAQAATDPASGAGATDAEGAVARLETRVGQLVQLIDEQQASYHRFLLFCGIVFCLSVIGTAGYVMYRAYTSKYEPPRLSTFIPVPIQIGDRAVLLGLQVVEWKVPDELNAVMVQAELQKRIADEKAAKEAAAQIAATNGPGSATTNPAAGKEPQPSK